MCLIATSETGVSLTRSELVTAYAHNPHAWGIAYVDKGRVHVTKGFSESAMLRAMERAEGHPYMLHFRYATHGNRGLGNGHPFRLHKHLYMSHNGVLDIRCPWRELSDTHHLAIELRSWFRDNPYLIHALDVQDTLMTKIGRGNKLAFIDETSSIVIVNEGAGKWIHEGRVWVSNPTTLIPYALENECNWSDVWRRYILPGASKVSTEWRAHEVNEWSGDGDIGGCDFCNDIGPLTLVADGSLLCFECMEEWSMLGRR